jgi:DNA-binding CsgD family transcriptional regulator
MGNQTDRLTAGIRPILDKTLENALAQRIAKEFPRIGGPRICQLCAQMILEVVHNHVRAKDSVRHGQVVWAAVSKDHRPGRYQRIAETDLVSVVLDVSTAEDIHAKIDRVPDQQRKLNRALRLCRQTYEQGGLLTCFDLSEIMGFSDSNIAVRLARYERENKTLVPRRGTLQDAGGGLSHKSIICYKRYVEGKSPEQIAQETYHSLTAVDRYLGQFDRVRHCRRQGLSPMETAHILNCTLRLVETYLQLDRELEGKDG